MKLELTSNHRSMVLVPIETEYPCPVCWENLRGKVAVETSDFKLVTEAYDWTITAETKPVRMFIEHVCETEAKQEVSDE